MEQTRLEKDLIPDPELWVLALRLSPSGLHVAALSLVEDNSLLCRHIPFAQGSDTVQALEDAVYDNPLLLLDFKKVWCIVESPRTLVVPAELKADPQPWFDFVYPSSGSTLLTDPLPRLGAGILTGIDPAIDRFLRRTFQRLTVMGHLVPLCRYFGSSRSNAAKMYVNLRTGSLDVIAIDSGRLLMANTFVCASAADAAYYILACRSTLGMNPETSELLLCGDQFRREEITPILRRYIRLVIPVIFPPRMFKAGRSAMQAPFDLIVTPLCE